MRDLWTSARSLWVKFCGIADEYKMLRDRWLYLYSKDKLPVLPYLRAKNPDEEEQTFDLLDRHVEKLEELFGKLGFDRNKMENYSDFRRATSGEDRVDLIDGLKLIEDYVYDLANFVGLLKFAFFQRTVSSEIPHVASGIPHSPERTIGNELFYLAADNVARRYYKCLNIPYGKWDGFITFTPPIEEGYFYGAFCYPSPYLELFHVSMSEEAKYFVGSYLMLAHEFGHAVMSRKIKHGEGAKVCHAAWVSILFWEIYDFTVEFLEDKKKYSCENCPIYVYFNDPKARREIYKYYVELLADIIAYYIAGKNYGYSFIDFAYNMISDPVNQVQFLLRTIPSILYLQLNKFSVKDLKSRIEKIINECEKFRVKYEIRCPNFFECVGGIGALWAERLLKFNNNFGNIIFNGLEDYIESLIYNYNPLQGVIDVERVLNRNLEEILILIFQDEKVGDRLIDLLSRGHKLFTIIIKKDCIFKINRNEQKNIINALIAGEPVQEKDPRHILHCYYEAYKQSEGEERPNYAATIYSLAFNTHNNSEKKKRKL